jgi:16S rRNA (cytosine967-C5)-methyltransferase
LQSNNEIPDFTVRINTLRISPEVFKKKLEEKDIEYSNGRYIENAVSIKNPSALINSDLNNKGYFYVQDEASMLVPIILDPKPNEIVVDVCAAPGGKSTHIAELMGNKGIVISRDIHPHKIELIKKSAEKLGINIIKTELQDAASLSDGQQDCRRNSQQNTCRDRQKDACQDSHRDNRQDSQYVMKADRVLVDAPCSGSGIIRRKPEIKWNRTPEQNEEIKKLQFKILTTSSKYVKIGGTLVYSTCSIEPDENIETVRNFLKSNNEFELTGFDELLPMSLAYAHETAKDGYINLFPNIDKTDGFFIAKMTRKS